MENILPSYRDIWEFTVRELAQKAHFGFYVHVPFCPHICSYCNFVKTAQFSRRDVGAFFRQLQQQLPTSATLPPAGTTVTVYFGGGTPSMVDPQYFRPLLEFLRSRYYLEEVTLESNPLRNPRQWMQQIRDLGVNRLTIGAQSLCPRTLQILGRKHSPDHVQEAIVTAREMGFDEVQVDMIYGLPPETYTRPLYQQLAQLHQWGATGVSAYALTIEKNTAFADLPWAHEEQAVRDYEDILAAATEFQWEQWETSNFSHTPPRHNNIYWYGLPYTGLGPGAHSFTAPNQNQEGGVRWSCGGDWTMQAVGDFHLPFAGSVKTDSLWQRRQESKRSYRQFIDEWIFSRLRTLHGLPLQLLDILPLIEADPILQRALNEKKINVTNNYLRISPQEKIRGDGWAVAIISLIK